MFDFTGIEKGNIVIILFSLVVMAFFVFNLRRIKTLSVRALTCSAFCITMATVLSYLKLFKMPQGGTVTACSMLFISLAGYFFGLGAGLLTGITHGLLQLILDPYVIHPMQLLLDYILAFGVIGLSGLFYKNKFGLEIGIVVGMLARFVMSTLSGVIFFAEYAPVGESPLIYSAVYNITYIAPEMLISLVIVSLPPVKRILIQIKHSMSSEVLYSGE